MKWYAFLLFLIANISLAAVWEDDFEWSQEWENSYSKWVKNELKTDIFSNPNSPFYGVKTDCADFVIAQRLIFSYLNKLPFYINEKINHYSSRFDSLETELERVKALIDQISDTYGSYALAKNLSYPIPLKEIRSGDIFIYREEDGNFHSYLVKDLRENGNFELWYSTVPKAVRKIIKRVGMPARPVTARPYGFRRLKTPSQIDHLLSLSEEHYQQYQMVRDLGPTRAMVEIKKTVRKRQETIPEAVERRISNSCSLLESRVESISMTAQLFNKMGYRCLNSTQYYNYSTPSRDKVLFESIIGLAELWLKVKKHNKEFELDSSTRISALNFLVGKELSAQAKNDLKKICPNTIPINFRQYILRFKKGILSSNPHHHISARWGAKQKITAPSWNSIKKCQIH